MDDDHYLPGAGVLVTVWLFGAVFSHLFGISRASARIGVLAYLWVWVIANVVLNYHATPRQEAT